MIVRTETYKDMEEDIATLMDVDEMFQIGRASCRERV